MEVNYGFYSNNEAYTILCIRIKKIKKCNHQNLVFKKKMINDLLTWQIKLFS